MRRGIGDLLTTSVGSEAANDPERLHSAPFRDQIRGRLTTGSRLRRRRLCSARRYGAPGALACSPVLSDAPGGALKSLRWGEFGESGAQDLTASREEQTQHTAPTPTAPPRGEAGRCAQRAQLWRPDRQRRPPQPPRSAVPTPSQPDDSGRGAPNVESGAAHLTHRLRGVADRRAIEVAAVEHYASHDSHEQAAAFPQFADKTVVPDSRLVSSLGLRYASLTIVVNHLFQGVPCCRCCRALCVY